MSQSYKIVYEGGEAEIIEKKSRFLAHVQRTDTVEAAEAFIGECKKKYWDARHNCSAFVIGQGAQNQRSSDDGEPSGTAGKPILEVLLGEQLTNVTVVVTRYFGGVLLGTGGLVRAYQRAVKEALRASVIMTRETGCRLKIKAGYNDVGRLQHLFAGRQIPIFDSEYTQDVAMSLVVAGEQRETLVKEITEATGGRAQICDEGNVSFGLADGRLILFDEKDD